MSDFDNSYDVASLAVAAKTKPTVYIDRTVPRHDSLLKRNDGTPADLWKYLRVHELAERRAMAAGMPYEKAHRYATNEERHAVITDCGARGWRKYEHIIDGLLAHIEHREVKNPPPDPHVDPKVAVESGRGDKPKKRADRR